MSDAPTNNKQDEPSDDRRLFDDLRSAPQPAAPLGSIESRANRIRRRRRLVPAAAGVIAIVLVAGIALFATRRDDREVRTSNNPPVTTESGTTTTPDDLPKSTTTAAGATTMLANPISFDAWMDTKDGVRTLWIRFTSEPPPGMALWAVTVNGHVVGRTNHSSQGTYGTNVTAFGQPISVILIAETADRTPIAESERVVVSL